MKTIKRRNFLEKSITASVGTLVGVDPLVRKTPGASDLINVAVVGIRSRGRDHYRALSKFPDVRITTLCDIDERLLAEAVAEVETLTGHKPDVETDYRKVLDNQNIDVVSLATPNHWHALQTIWACQAGKDVYVEKPVSHTLEEGRKMVEAARKYGRVVQAGIQARSNPSTIKAIDFATSGQLGKIYMAKGLCFKPRGSIGHTKDEQVPEGVNWDRFLGPAPYRPFNPNRFHYKWHWFWDTGNGDLGNQGIHQADIARWTLEQDTHPVVIRGYGDYLILDSDQETPNIQHLIFEYEDGSLLQFEVRGLPTNSEGDLSIGNLIYGSEGWMRMGNEEQALNQAFHGKIQLNPSGFSSYEEEAGPDFGDPNMSPADTNHFHFDNFLNCVKSRRWQDLNADILQGHLSTSLCHLGNIACRLGRTLHFNPHAEKFVNDDEADSYLTKPYRAPYLLPAQV